MPRVVSAGQEVALWKAGPRPSSRYGAWSERAERRGDFNDEGEGDVTVQVRDTRESAREVIGVGKMLFAGKWPMACGEPTPTSGLWARTAPSPAKMERNSLVPQSSGHPSSLMEWGTDAANVWAVGGAATIMKMERNGLVSTVQRHLDRALWRWGNRRQCLAVAPAEPSKMEWGPVPTVQRYFGFRPCCGEPTPNVWATAMSEPL